MDIETAGASGCGKEMEMGTEMGSGSWKEMEMETEMGTEMMASEAVATRTANRSVCNPQRPPHRTLRTLATWPSSWRKTSPRPTRTNHGPTFSS